MIVDTLKKELQNSNKKLKDTSVFNHVGHNSLVRRNIDLSGKTLGRVG